MAPGLLVDKDKGSADLLSSKILYGILSGGEVGGQGGTWGMIRGGELKNYQDRLCPVSPGGDVVTPVRSSGLNIIR